MFSTIQKFGLTKEDRDAGRPFPLLSERSNIVVIADEAHRTNYDLIDGFARHLRDALPNATFIGFTGTPIETADRNTRAIFGDYIDVYDLTQAVKDGATVKVYYEARLAKVELPDEARADPRRRVRRSDRAGRGRDARADEDPLGAGRGDRRGSRSGSARWPQTSSQHWEQRRECAHWQGADRLHVAADLRRPVQRDRQAAPRLALRRRRGRKDQGRHHRVGRRRAGAAPPTS